MLRSQYHCNCEINVWLIGVFSLNISLNPFAHQVFIREGKVKQYSFTR